MKAFGGSRPETISGEVHVNWGRLLEDNLRKFKGKHHHARGLAEYITNADDSYRRQGKFFDQEIEVELISFRKGGRYLDKVVIRDAAEGMSHDGLENDFFLYFESHSGRSEGKSVTGKFGTGGKAYAIMNFVECWITSVNEKIECKAWFKWDGSKQKIIKGYDKGGYVNKPVEKPNGTVLELLKSDNYFTPTELINRLNEIARIRHVIKNQNVKVKISQGKSEAEVHKLEYDQPTNFIQSWDFDLPDSLRSNVDDRNKLVIRYFERPFSKSQSIDVQDGISSIVDLPFNQFDERSFNKYLSGEVVIAKLKDSTAVQENRKGLEPDDDLTVEILEFLRDKVGIVIGEIQELQRQKEKERNIEVSSKKVSELNKFLRKVEMNFRESLNELRRSKRPPATLNDDGLDDGAGYRRPVDADLDEYIFPGVWEPVQTPDGDKPRPWPASPNSDPPIRLPVEVFTPAGGGTERGVVADISTTSGIEQTKRKRGLTVMMTDDPESPVDSSEYGQYEEPVIDKFLRSDGIILINVNNPIIEKSRSRKDLEHIFKERVANFVLLVVAQHQTERELAIQQEEDRDDPLQVFRRKFFELQNDLRSDKEISYFDEESPSEGERAG